MKKQGRWHMKSVAMACMESKFQYKVHEGDKKVAGDFCQEQFQWRVEA